ncbi:MAG: hypothetical protein JSV88_07075 [Candidatus Aminicenantes bacterium]|nr:MAG: hypothetical protein JSV88_07075 [Candidatus Aminicenantes bacterium]
MANERIEKIKAEIEKCGYGNSNTINQSLSLLLDHGLESLNILVDYMAQDLPIETIERWERLSKDLLKGIFSGPYSSDLAREAILVQKRLGFLLKYKSYAIKASHPLGYSIFIQNKGQGFSFQQHITHKTEVFHILEVLNGGYVFTCDYKDWQKNYEEKAFTDWLSGKPDQRYDQFRIYPRPGDVFSIDKLGIVHTVIGCVLEEYATVSTDMVERLFDQNAGRKIPSFFNRDYTRERLISIKFPGSSRHVNINLNQKSVTEIKPLTIPGGTKLPLSAGHIFASRYRIEPAKASEPMVDRRCASGVYFTRGKGQLIVGNEKEVNQLTPPSIPVSAGDLVLIPNGIYYAFVCEGTDPLECSEQRTPFDVAFV